jgi:hypothetical protein
METAATFSLSPLPPEGDVQHYRVTGPLTFANMLALEQAVARLDGVTSANLVPQREGEATLTLVSAHPRRTTQDLLSLPDFPMRWSRHE